MEFPSYIQRQSLINNALEKYFDEKHYPEILFEAMKYSVSSGGKRMRSVLCLFAYELFKEDYEKAIPTSIAIEFIHSYSLIHDDLPAIDNDDLRRGMLTCHKKFGEDIAILAGDALFAEAFKIITTIQEGSDKQIARVVKVLATATGPEGMVGGQVMDVLSEKSDIDISTLNYIHMNKTAKLIKASAIAGAVLGGAKEEDIETVSKYAENLGMAFQITDDILDITRSTEELGKPAKSDIDKNKATYPSLVGLEAAKTKAEEHRAFAVDIIDKIDKNKDLEKLAFYVTERRY